MREILFRGKAVDNGEWIYGDLVNDTVGAHSQIVEVGIKPHGCYPIEVIPETVGEYVGLKDQDRIYIYEGDLVKLKTYIGGNFIEYSYEQCVAVWSFYGFSLKPLKGQYKISLCLSETTTISVIGNIHDNPNLLNNETSENQNP